MSQGFGSIAGRCTSTATSAGGVLTERASRYIGNTGRYELESKGWRPVAVTGVTEPPRAWVRRRLDQAGRLIAAETFADKPAPWNDGSDPVPVSSVSYAYSGNVTVETDAAGRTREETRDALGRLIAVKQAQENPTVYGYNARDMLVTVTQTDTSNYGAGMTQTQTRTFGYDSLGRLKSAANPESGTQSYEYEADGLLKKKTDARGVSVTMSYDGARRLTGKTYSDGTAAVLYCYDGMVYSGGTCAAQPGRAGDAADYPKGRLTGSGNANGWTNAVRVDALGRPVRVEQGVGTFTQVVEYEYAANGARKRVVYPSGRQVSYVLTDRGRVREVNGAKEGQTVKYLTGAKYGAGGEAVEGQLGDQALLERKGYNAMGQMTEMDVTRGTALVGRLTFDYGGPGTTGICGARGS